MLINMKSGLIVPTNVSDCYTLNEFESVLLYLQHRFDTLKLLQYYYNQYLVWDYETADFFSKDETAEEWEHKFCFSEDLRVFWDVIDSEYDSVSGGGNNGLSQSLFLKFAETYPDEAENLVVDSEYSQTFVYSNDYNAMFKFVEFTVNLFKDALRPLSNMFVE